MQASSAGECLVFRERWKRRVGVTRQENRDKPHGAGFRPLHFQFNQFYLFIKTNFLKTFKLTYWLFALSHSLLMSLQKLFFYKLLEVFFFFFVMAITPLGCNILITSVTDVCGISSVMQHHEQSDDQTVLKQIPKCPSCCCPT